MRINIIEPRYLADQHLVAEYREIKMLPKCLIRSLQSKKGLDENRIPEKYTLNTGHGYFFYNKLTFIIKRFNALLVEMQLRGFQTNFDNMPFDGIPQSFFNDYKPDEEAVQINLERIRLRINAKKYWFKHYGAPMSDGDWDRLYYNYCKLNNFDYKTIEELQENPGLDNYMLKQYKVNSGHK